MRVMLIVKGESPTRAIEAVRSRLTEMENAHVLIPFQMRMGAFRFEIEMDAVAQVFQWFNQGGHSAPFPDGTLLFFTINP